MSRDDSWTLRETADELGCSPDTLSRALPAWIRDRNFPPPLDIGTGRTRHLRFDRQAVIDWKQRGGMNPPAARMSLSIDWHRIAELRGDALDHGRDPDLIAELNPAA